LREEKNGFTQRRHDAAINEDSSRGVVAPLREALVQCSHRSSRLLK
jgi:hypothetical protein